MIWAFRASFVYSRSPIDQLSPPVLMKTCPLPHLLWLIMALAGSSAILCGCGQDGNLYLPEKDQSQEQEQEQEQLQEQLQEQSQEQDDE
jgi:predicted small lipoprotein YifL